jgi:hypothetical protein
MITNMTETLFSLENEPTYASVCIRRGGEGRKIGNGESRIEYGCINEGRVGRGESG